MRCRTPIVTRAVSDLFANWRVWVVLVGSVVCFAPPVFTQGTVLKGGVTQTEVREPALSCKSLFDAEEKRHADVYKALQAKEEEIERNRIQEAQACRANQGCEKGVNDSAAAKARAVSAEARAEDAENNRRIEEINKRCAAPETKGNPPISVKLPAPELTQPRKPKTGVVDAGIFAGPARWTFKVAEGVTLSACEAAVKPGAVQAVGGVTLTTGTGVAILASCGEGLTAAAGTGAVCLGAGAVAQTIADAQRFADPNLKAHEALQDADRQLRERSEQYAREQDDLAREQQSEDLRHQRAEREMAEQARRLQERHQQNMKNPDADARAVEDRRFKQNQQDLQRLKQEELQRNAAEKASLQKRQAEGKQQYRREAGRIVDGTTDDKSRQQRERAEIERRARDIDQRAVRPPVKPASPTLPEAAEQARLQRIADFRLAWEKERGRYLGYNDGWKAMSRFEQERHASNPFQTAAEIARHNTEVARLNDLARCQFADHLANLDAIRLKYQAF